jgi:hypothetical protein
MLRPNIDKIKGWCNTHPQSAMDSRAGCASSHPTLECLNSEDLWTDFTDCPLCKDFDDFSGLLSEKELGEVVEDAEEEEEGEADLQEEAEDLLSRAEEEGVLDAEEWGEEEEGVVCLEDE